MSTSAPFAAIEAMLTNVTMAQLANVQVATEAGQLIAAQFDLVVDALFDGVRGADYIIRYAGPNPLNRGDFIRVIGSPLIDETTELQVYEKPTPLGAGYEYTAALVRAV
jgi:hypothetical protein